MLARRRTAPGRLAALVASLSCAAALALVSAAGAAAEGAASSAPPAPANDALANAQPVGTLPATISGTTVGATTEPNERQSACGASTTNSVWYSIRLTSAHRVALDLTAAGALDATVDVYHAVRSQLESVGCQQTEGEGKASFSFKAAKNGLYDIRVAAVQGSQLAGFTLEVFTPTPAVHPPGAPLPAAGASGQVDPIQDVNAAYAVTLHAGVSYLVSLANETRRGACVNGTLFAPGTSSFGNEEPGEEEEERGSGGVLHLHCGGYRLFTPGPGEGGLYSFEITPRFSHRGVQRFHLQIAPAGPAETTPGIALPNYAHAHGYLSARSVRVLRLYRMEVTSHSNLTLKLSAPESAHFKLELRNINGDVIECDCEGNGSQTLSHQLRPGTYYAVVAARGETSGSFTLVRESRTITATSISFSTGQAAPGEGVDIDVKVSPEESGPVEVEIDRFDPVFGWQFYQEVHTSASGGLASIPFTPPTVGLWRAKATYNGTLTASPSAVGHTFLHVS
jgi:hypothetical protein